MATLPVTPIYILKPIFIFCLNNIYRSITCRTFRTLNFYVPTKENPPSQETQGVEDSTGIVLEEVRMRIPPSDSTCIFIQCQMMSSNIYLMLTFRRKKGVDLTTPKSSQLTETLQIRLNYNNNFAAFHLLFSFY